MSEHPENLRYTKEHEWARKEDDGSIVIGITKHAVDALGDITMVSLPDPDSDLNAGESFGDIDSVKAVSELYAPMNGSVAEINEALEDAPESINEDPYGAGWMLKIKPADAGDFDGLMTAADYAKYLSELED